MYAYGLPRWLSGKESTRQYRRCRLDPWVQKIHWSRNSNPFQYSYLENSMVRGTWWATVHGITELDMTEQARTYTYTYIFAFTYLCKFTYLMYCDVGIWTQTCLILKQLQVCTILPVSRAYVLLLKNAGMCFLVMRDWEMTEVSWIVFETLSFNAGRPQTPLPSAGITGWGNRLASSKFYFIMYRWPQKIRRTW